MDQNCGKTLFRIRISGQPIDPELATIEEDVFPVDLGSGFEGVEEKVIRPAACNGEQ